jgi:hypothetical protein
MYLFILRARNLKLASQEQEWLLTNEDAWEQSEEGNR